MSCNYYLLYMLSVFKEPILLSHVFILTPLHLIGFFRFKRGIELMLGSNIVISAFFLYFGATWLLISPVALLVCSKSFKCQRFLNKKKSYASINWYVINFHQSTNIASFLKNLYSGFFLLQWVIKFLLYCIERLLQH